MKPIRWDTYKGVGGKWGAVQLELQDSYYTIPQKTKFKNYDGRWIQDSWRDDIDWDNQWNEDDLVMREGVIFLDIASTIAPNKYDWENKIVFALNVKDIGLALLVLEGTEQVIKILHDPKAGSDQKGKVTKVLELSSPNGIEKGCMLKVTEKNTATNTNKSHTVPLSGDEVKILRLLLQKAVTSILCW